MVKTINLMRTNAFRGEVIKSDWGMRLNGEEELNRGGTAAGREGGQGRRSQKFTHREK